MASGDEQERNERYAYSKFRGAVSTLATSLMPLRIRLLNVRQEDLRGIVDTDVPQHLRADYRRFMSALTWDETPSRRGEPPWKATLDALSDDTVHALIELVVQIAHDWYDPLRRRPLPRRQDDEGDYDFLRLTKDEREIRKRLTRKQR